VNRYVAARQVSWLPGLPRARRGPPSRLPRLYAEWLLGLAARLQWRDRAGFRPASLEGPFGRHGGGNYASTR